VKNEDSLFFFVVCIHSVISAILLLLYHTKSIQISWDLLTSVLLSDTQQTKRVSTSVWQQRKFMTFVICDLMRQSFSDFFSIPRLFGQVSSQRGKKISSNKEGRKIGKKKVFKASRHQCDAAHSYQAE